MSGCEIQSSLETEFKHLESGDAVGCGGHVSISVDTFITLTPRWSSREIIFNMNGFWTCWFTSKNSINCFPTHGSIGWHVSSFGCSKGARSKGRRKTRSLNNSSSASILMLTNRALIGWSNYSWLQAFLVKHMSSITLWKPHRKITTQIAIFKICLEGLLQIKNRIHIISLWWATSK